MKDETVYWQLFQKSPLPLHFCDAQTLDILKANDAALSLYGYSEEEFLKLNVVDLRLPEQRAAFYQFINQVRNTSDFCQYLTKHVKKNGETMVVEFTAISIAYENRNCLLISTTDQSEIVKLKREVTAITRSARNNITKAALEAQEKQRQEIGEELHDNINQVLATAKLYLSCVQDIGGNNLQLIKKSEGFLKYCIDEITRLSRSLVPPSMGESSLKDAIGDLIGRLQFIKGELIEHHIIDLKEHLFDEGHKISIYRIIQEQLNNILKYAEASRITIMLWQTYFHLNVLIADNGRGFNLNQTQKGLGLQNIKNRAEMYNGSVQIESYPGIGTSVMVVFDIEPPLRRSES